jgi:iron(III) transport system permease protein
MDLAAESFGIPSGEAGRAWPRPAGKPGRIALKAGLAAVLLLLFVLPLAMLFLGALRSGAPGQPGSWTLAGLEGVLSSASVARAAGSSLLLAGTATVIAGLIAAPLSYLAERTDLPWRRWVAPAMVMLFATPGVFYAVAWSELGNRYTGYLNALYAFMTGSPAAPFNIESWPGLILVVTLKKIAFFYLFLLGPVRAFNRSYEEASLIAGRGRIATFFGITLPLLAPALGGVALMGLAGSLHSFDIPLIIGAPAGIDVVSFRIYEMLSATAPPDYSQASAASVLLILAVLALQVAQMRLLGRRSYVMTEGKAIRTSPVRLGRWRWAAGGLVAALLLVSIGLPLGALLYASVQPYAGVYSSLSLANYGAVLGRPETAEAFLNTAILALVVGAVTMVLALVLAEAGRTLGAATNRGIRLVTLIPQATPGLVIALAVMWAYVSVPGLREVYGTIWLMAAALIVVAMPLAISQVNAATGQIGRDLGEAARIAGARPARAYFDIVLPLIAPSFLAGWCVVGVAVAGNIEVPLLLGAPGLNTVAVEIYSLNALGRGSEAAALLVLMMLAFAATGGLVFLGLKLAGALRRRRSRSFFSEPF